MQPHIARTIEDIDLQIGFLQRLKGALENFGGPADLHMPANGSPPPQAKLNGDRAVTRPEKVVKKIGRTARRNSRDLEDRIRGLVHAGKLREPFHSIDVAELLDHDRVACTTALTKLCASGELTLAGKDGLKKLYRRTARLSKPSEPSQGEKMLQDIHREIDAQKPKDD